MNLNLEVEKLKQDGYSELNAVARLCQDVVLAAIDKANLSHSVTIKGGVVLRNLSRNMRRATQDLDFDFIRHPISDEAIETFVKKLNCLDGIELAIVGDTEELNHQDYKGKRVHLEISDREGARYGSKLDIGVHRDLDVVQDEFCFDICFSDDGASLLMNSPEQVIVEKLKSLLRFGVGCTRYKDVYDIFFLSDLARADKVGELFAAYVYADATLNIKTPEEILSRINSIKLNKRYRQRLAASKKNWIAVDDDRVFEGILSFLSEV